MPRFPVIIILTTLLFSCQGPHFDTLIRKGTVYDGSGAPGKTTDIGIEDGKIKAVGNLKRATADTIIEAVGLAVAPGFIDLHTHLEPLLELADCESHLRQGVTTALGSPDGSGPFPLKPYLDTLESIGTGMNVGFLVGHNTVRNRVMGLDNRAPSPAELDSMRRLIAQGMEDGAFGISTGLKYLPGNFAKTDEVIELSKEAAQRGGFYTSHLRDEGLQLLDGVGEAIQIAAGANIPVVLTHHKVIGKSMWGASTQTLAMIDSARARGLDVMADQYPYLASYTGIAVLIPSWAMANDGKTGFVDRLKDPILRDSIRKGILFNLERDRGGGDLRRIQFAKVAWMPELEGKTLYDWVVMEQMEPTLENGAELVIRAQVNRGASCIFHAMDEEDVVRIMQHPQTMIASDGRLVRPGDGHPHPRWYGTFPRVLGEYVRDKKVLPLETAVYKMTGLPAKRMGLKDRGLLQAGFAADITIFDPNTVADLSTYEKPHQYPSGIQYVLVNGRFAVREGIFRDVRTGQVLRGPATKIQ